MLGFNRWHLLKGLAVILCIVGIVSLAWIIFFLHRPRNLQSPRVQKVKPTRLSASGIGKYLLAPMSK